MSYKSTIVFSFLFLLVVVSCNGQTKQTKTVSEPSSKEEVKEVRVGGDQLDKLLPLIDGKTVAVVANQTSVLSNTNTHLVDTLLSLGINVKTVFSPEHGFRGMASAGEKVASGKDIQTGLPIISLYGKHKKPTKADLNGVDIVIFDIQDVGARFYTYISTMHYIMEACAENNKQCIILDRPNPNGFYVDGPILEKQFKSFVGMHPIPVVHGLTVGELAKMIQGESWLKSKDSCKLNVITCENYAHTDFYELPIAPSPNLPTMESIYAYPSLCFFEGTDISVGRGTKSPFQIIGSPILDSKEFSFIPKELNHAKDPKHEGVECKGYDLTVFSSFYFKKTKAIYWYWLANTHQVYKEKGKPFFTRSKFFDLLAGNNKLRKAILDGKTEKEIKASYQERLASYKEMRKKYLLYKDFE